MRTTSRRIALTLSLLTAGMSGQALAFDNDPALSRLCVRTGMVSETPCGTQPRGDQAAFKNLSREYGVAMAPQLLSPAETMGVNGFQFDVQFSVSTINNNRAYWLIGIEDETPPGSLVVSRIGVRKGLPFSFEVGMNTSYLIESELWLFGTMVKWALNEAMSAIPVDLAIRGSYNQMLGSPQLEMSMFGMDIILSKSFGVAGILNLAPYVAYSPLWVLSRSAVLDSTPGTLDSPNGDFVFTDEEQLVHRYLVGARFIMGLFNLGAEVGFAPSQQTFSVNLGVDF